MYISPISEGLPVTIIENTKHEGKQWESHYGSSFVVLTPEHLAALKDGKLLTFNDGEYSTFIGYRS